jgi:hypothetical protein
MNERGGVILLSISSPYPVSPSLRSCEPTLPLQGGIITLTQHKAYPTYDAALADLSSAGAPDTLILTRSILVQAVEAELKEYFDDGVGPTLGQYAIDHIIGGIVGRVLGAQNVDIPGAQTTDRSSKRCPRTPS